MKKFYFCFEIPRQILSYNQNINKNSSADWSVWSLRGKTIKTKNCAKIQSKKL